MGKKLSAISKGLAGLAKASLKDKERPKMKMKKGEMDSLKATDEIIDEAASAIMNPQEAMKPAERSPSGALMPKKMKRPKGY